MPMGCKRAYVKSLGAIHVGDRNADVIDHD